jgi:hypothetical protein
LHFLLVEYVVADAKKCGPNEVWQRLWWQEDGLVLTRCQVTWAFNDFKSARETKNPFRLIRAKWT